MAAGRPRSESAQQAILVSTRDELAARGYDKLSIDRVARAAGVGKQTVYRWYASKNALVAECLLNGYLSMPTIQAGSNSNVRADVETWVVAFSRRVQEPETLNLIRAASAAAAEDAEIARRFDEQLTVTRSELVARLHRGVDDGQVKAGTDLGIVTELIVGAVQYRLLTRQEIPDDFVRELIDVVFAGIGSER